MNITRYFKNPAAYILPVLIAGMGSALVASCARMGSPDGGWYDETPPYVVSASPAEYGTNASSKRIRITFNEFVKIDNAQEKVVISPPQMEQPVIKAQGKHIIINLQDSLQSNTTYTVDFSDAISDNNEGNPMGNYTYTFSTGDVIDTMEVSGYVLDAQTLEPIKGIMVGTFSHPAGESGDGAFTRVSRTDSRGYFVIRGIAPGKYTVGAVQDMDGDFRFTQRGEMMAFSHDIISPSSFPDKRQDTIWADEMHIKDIQLTPYTHFVPDNIVLRAFNHQPTDRYFLKSERIQPDRFTLFFTAPALPPTLLGLNFPSDDAFIVEPSAHGDTVTFWLRDTVLINQDTLRLAMTTYITDTLGVLQLTTDTLEILAKTPYAKRMKQQEIKEKEWRQKLEKRLKHAKEGDVIDTIMPREKLQPNIEIPRSMTPDDVVHVTFAEPMRCVDTTAVHLYVEQDSLWYRVPFSMAPVPQPGDALLKSMAAPDSTLAAKQDIPAPALPRYWEIYSDWIPGAQYSLEIDSLAFENIYGLVSDAYKSGPKIEKLESFGTLFVKVITSDTAQVIVQLLDKSDKVLRSAPATDGTAEFYYIPSGTYYLRAFIDSNGNGIWDTGDYFADRQPEQTFYYNDPVECKAKWDITKTWNLTSRPLYLQKPDALVKQKAEKKKTVRNRNEKRAQEKGIKYNP